MDVQHTARVNRLLNAHPYLEGPNADLQHDLVVAAIMGSMAHAHDRARLVVSFETYAILREEAYLTSIFEALIIGHLDKHENIFQEIRKNQRSKSHEEMWMVYPTLILAYIRAALWCDAHSSVDHADFVKMAPWYIGGLVRDYVIAADGAIPESQWCSKWALGEISNNLTAYLGPVPTRETIRRAREIMHMMDECEQYVHRPVHKLVSQFTHRAFSMINMRAQIAILKRGFDEYGNELAVPEQPVAA